MKVNSTILQHEFIGLKAKVVNSTNPSYLGVKGKVIDETRNTFKILQNNERKTLVKEVSVFHFTLLDGQIVEINGKTLVGRPEDRVKRRLRRRW